MKQDKKTAAADLEALRSELEREKKKKVRLPERKLKLEAETEQKLLQQLNKKQNSGKGQDVVKPDEKNVPSTPERHKDYISGQSQELNQLKEELKREKYKSRYASVLRSTVGTLVVVAAIAILVATLWMPVLQIYGSSMTPTLKEGQIVVSVKGADIEQGDLVAFYLGNKLLVKRVIAGPADIVDIGRDGTVSVNGSILDEPYISEKAKGECDLKFPYQVPDSKYFLMGDHRDTSIDSRMSAVGCVAEEQIVGKIICRIWPVTDMKVFH